MADKKTLKKSRNTCRSGVTKEVQRVRTHPPPPPPFCPPEKNAPLSIQKT